MRVPVVLLILVLLVSIPTANGALIVRVDIKGEINQGTAILVDYAFKKAEDMKADAILIVLDTPGGLLSATKEIVSDILNSDIPVITYVYPPGAFSASAGSLILISGNIAAMSNGTSVGAATPYVAGFPPKVENKTVNYIASYAKSIAEMRHRPAELIEKFVTEGLSLPAKEAYEKGVIDVLADSPQELFRKINGWTVDVKGRAVRLNLETVEIVRIKAPLKADIYDILTNPIVAFVLLILGIYCLIFGLMTPGLGMEIVGTLCLILALFGLGAISLNVFAVFLILLGILLLVLELITPTYGILGVASVICVTLGCVMLFNEPLMPKGFYRDFAMFAGGMSLGMATVMTFVIVKVAQARRMRKKVGGEAMIGEVGEVIEFENGRGLVKVRGELWQCKSEDDLKSGDEVVVTGRDGLILFVRRK